MRNILLLAIFTISAFYVQAQDRLFSQSYAAPLTLNPALTGAFDGKFRVSAIYRDQWKKVLEEPYTTYAASLDFRWGLGNYGANYNDLIGVGVVFFTDQAGALDFSTTTIAVSGAFHKALDPRSRQYISGGMQVGIVQRNINYANISFQDQFDGLTGFVDPTAENLPENNYAFGDFSMGLNYAYTPKPRTSIFVGAGFHHFLTPDVSFYNRTDDTDIFGEDPLDPKISVQLSGSVPLGESVSILPRILGSLQGPHTKIDAGMNLRFALGELKTIALHIGGYARTVSNHDDSFGVASVVSLVGIEYSNVLFGFSYDLNLDDVSTQNLGQRAFEISIAYLGEYEDDLLLCPKF